MNLRWMVLGVSAVIVLASGCAANKDLANEVNDQSIRLGSLESQLAALEVQFGEVSTSVSGLTASIEEMATAEEAHAPRFDVAVAQFVMDTAGFHAMEEALASGNPIDPSAVSTVGRVHKIVSSTEFPEELQEAVEGFLGDLEALEAVLEADDAADAAPLAAAVHESQHDLSHMIDEWLGAAGGEHQEG
jgi:hypothetical protein